MRHDDGDEERRSTKPTPTSCSRACASESRQGLRVRHVQQTEHGWQLTSAHRLSGVLQWDPENDGALPLVIVNGRRFTWGQTGRMMMMFEGFTLNAIVEDTIEVQPTHGLRVRVGSTH